LPHMFFCFCMLFLLGKKECWKNKFWLLQHGNEERRRNLPSFLLLQLIKELADCWVKVYKLQKKFQTRKVYRLCKNYR
jgi:hypothetical protein